VKKFDIVNVMINVGGFSITLWALFKLVNYMYESDSLSHVLAPKFYRKPEMYKYAHATKLDKQAVISGKMSVEAFNDL
jgi:hypothetical protein